MLGKFTESFFAEPLDPLSHVGTSAIEVRDSQIESALEQRLRFILVRHRTNLVPEPKPTIETISPVLPSRRFGSEFALPAPSAMSADSNTMRAAVLFRNSRRVQPGFMIPPFEAERYIRVIGKDEDNS